MQRRIANSSSRCVGLCSVEYDTKDGACDRNSNSLGLASKLEIPATPGKWYAVHVGSYAGPLVPVTFSGAGDGQYSVIPLAVGLLVLNVTPRIANQQVDFYG